MSARLVLSLRSNYDEAVSSFAGEIVTVAQYAALQAHKHVVTALGGFVPLTDNLKL